MNQNDFEKLGLCATTSLGLLLIAGCHRDHSHSSDHHQGEELKTAQITVWGERHEIFAEHRFVVAGQPT
jgi:hypothetical protein